MIYKAYRVAIAYFALFSLLLLYSIVALVDEKIGFSLTTFTEYYSEKSIEGLLEVAIPHFMAIALFVMVLSHFFLFTSLSKKISKAIVFYYLITTVLITAVFFKLYLLKLIAMLIFLTITSLFALLLLREIFKK